MDESALQKLKSKFITLTIDQEDKENLIKLLEQKCSKKREELASVEDTISSTYKEKLENEEKLQSEKITNIIEDIKKLNDDKAKLLQECQELVQDYKHWEDELQFVLSSIHKEGENNLEYEQKQFKATQEDRLNKYLSMKANEYIESTNRAMAPEFIRLTQAHNQELIDLELIYQGYERQVKEEYYNKCNEELKVKRLQWEQNDQHNIQDLHMSNKQEVMELYREQKKEISHIQDTIEKDINMLQQSLTRKYEKEKEKNTLEIQKCKEEIERKINEMTSQHKEEILILKKNHDLQMKELTMKSKKLKDRLLQKVTQSSTSISPRPTTANSTIVTTTTLMNEDQLSLSSTYEWNSVFTSILNDIQHYKDSTTTNTTTNVTALDNKFDSKLIDNVTQDQQSYDYHSSSSSTTNTTTTICSTTATELTTPLSLEIEKNNIIHELKKDRDIQLQHAIKQLQKDHILLEQNQIEQLEKEKNNFFFIHEIEEKDILKRLQLKNEDLSEAILKRDKIKTVTQSLEFQIQETQKKEQTMRDQIHTIQLQYQEITQKIHDMKHKIDTYTTQELQEKQEIEKQQQQRISQLEEDIISMKRLWDKKKETHITSHQQYLAQLDVQVKRQVEEQNQIMKTLQEQIDEESLKVQTLHTHIEQYTTNTTTNTNTIATKDNHSGTNNTRSNSNNNSSSKFGHESGDIDSDSRLNTQGKKINKPVPRNSSTTPTCTTNTAENINTNVDSSNSVNTKIINNRVTTANGTTSRKTNPKGGPP